MTWIKSGKLEPIYVPPSWSDGTDAEIVKALEKHYAGELDLREYWAVGDERQVTLSAMSATGVGESHAQQTVTFVISNIGGKYLADGVTECAFQVDQKDCLKEKGYMNSTDTNTGGWKSCARRTWCNSVYKNAIPSTIQSIFKEFINQSGVGNKSTSGVENTTDTFALRAEIEVFGLNAYSVSGEGSQIEWYETSSNKKKKSNGSNSEWWERSPTSDSRISFCDISDGTYTSYNASGKYGIAPFGVI